MSAEHADLSGRGLSSDRAWRAVLLWVRCVRCGQKASDIERGYAPPCPDQSGRGLTPAITCRHGVDPTRCESCGPRLARNAGVPEDRIPAVTGRVSSWTDCLDGDCGKCDACRALAVREAQRHERENPPNEDEQMGAS